MKLEMTGGLMGQAGLHQQSPQPQPINPRSLMSGAPMPRPPAPASNSLLDDALKIPSGGLGGAPRKKAGPPPGDKKPAPLPAGTPMGGGMAKDGSGVTGTAPVPVVSQEPLPPLSGAAGLGGGPIAPAPAAGLGGDAAAGLGVDGIGGLAGAGAGAGVAGLGADAAGVAGMAELGGSLAEFLPLLLLAQGGRVGYAGGGHISGRGLTGPGSHGGVSAFSDGGRGLVQGAGAGRKDTVKTLARRGSYVLPADVVSGAGEGNSLAGASAIQRRVAKLGGGKFARGGDVGARADLVPVAFSGGEYVLWPEEVEELGAGDHEAGSQRLDQFVAAIRQAARAAVGRAKPPA